MAEIGLREIQNIDILKELIKLNLSCNCLCDIKPLRALVSLADLNLAENDM
jgi:Leucine-rich repeat (LRR) protein